MKKSFVVLLIGLISLTLAACNSSGESGNDAERLIGFIRIEENALLVDGIEWITDEDAERINELGLTRQDMPNGYYINNPSSDTTSFELTDETVYEFIDWGQDFVGENEDRNVSGTDREQFIQYLATYSDNAAKVPFWVEVKDGYVLRVTEQFVN